LDQTDSGEIPKSANALEPAQGSRSRDNNRRESVAVISSQFKPYPLITVADNMAFSALAGKLECAVASLALRLSLGLSDCCSAIASNCPAASSKRVAVGRARRCGPLDSR